MKKITLLIATVLLQNFFFAQTVHNLRKAILQSDIIIDTRNYDREDVWINDLKSISYIKMNKIDSTNSRILRNKLSTVPKKLTMREYRDGEDFFTDFKVNYACNCLGKALDPEKSYSDLFFVVKDKNEYRVLAHLYDLEWEQREKYRLQIETIKRFENIQNEKERFTKTLDWFIENGFLPDTDFVEYYKYKGITTDTIQYSEKQYQNAKQKFLQGNEDLLPIIKSKYFDEVKQYYVQKMEKIIKTQEPKFNDYWNFDKAFSAIVGDDLEIDSIDYILNNSLTSDKFESYDKIRIMRYLLDVAKDWDNSNEAK